MKKIFMIALFTTATSWAQEPTSYPALSVKKAQLSAKKNKSSHDNSLTILPPPEISQEIEEIETPKKEISVLPLSEHHFGLHADLNIPHILNYGIDYWHVSKWFSASINLGGYSLKGFSKTTELPDGVNFKIANQEAVLRLHPFASAFYLAFAYGTHTLEGSGTATYNKPPMSQSVTTTITSKITANYSKPHVGWMWRTSYGLTWGLDLGILIPNNVKITLDEGSITNDPLYPILASTSEYKANKKAITDKSDQYGNASLPYWAIARVGWLF